MSATMSVLAEIFRATSVNGRWGLAVVAPKGVQLPAEGSLRFIGTIGGTETYVFTPGPTMIWVRAVWGNAIPRAGAAVVSSMSLQGRSYVTLLVTGPYALIEVPCRRGQGSTYYAYKEGKELLVGHDDIERYGLKKTEDGAIIPRHFAGATWRPFTELLSRLKN